MQKETRAQTSWAVQIYAECWSPNNKENQVEVIFFRINSHPAGQMLSPTYLRDIRKLSKFNFDLTAFIRSQRWVENQVPVSSQLNFNFWLKIL